MINCQFQHYQGHRRGLREQHPRNNNGNGFRKIESFFSDIFGCAGGACNIVPSGMAPSTLVAHPTNNSTDAGLNRSYSSLRPLPEEDDGNEFYGNNIAHNGAENSRCSGGSNHRHRQQHKQRPDVDAHKTNDVSFSSTNLNETGTTYLDSSFFDESTLCSASSHGIEEIHEFVIPSAPKDALHQQYSRPRQTIMVPTETVVGIWPPVLPQQWQQPLPRGPSKEEEHDNPLPFPKRPPKIRRLTLDDALVVGQPMSSSSTSSSAPQCHRNETSSRAMGPSRDLLECVGDQSTHDGKGLRKSSVPPPIPGSVYRSRSLDFLFSGKRQGSRSRHQESASSNDRKEHYLHRCRRQQERLLPVVPSRKFPSDRCFEDPTRNQLVNLLSDLHETYRTM